MRRFLRKSARCEFQIGLLQAVLNASPNPCFFKDFNGIYLGCNRAFADLVGRTVESIAGQDDFALFPHALALFFRDKDAFVAKTGESHRNQEWVVYPNGRRCLLDTLKAPLWDQQDQLIGVVGIGLDITESDRARSNLERGQEMIGMGTWWMDIETRQMGWSPQLATILGLDPKAVEPTLELVLSYVHPDDRERVQTDLGRILQTGEGSRIEYRVIRADGAVRWVQGWRGVARDTQGQPIRIDGIGWDITERVRAEAAQREFAERLAQLNRVCATVSGELNTTGVIALAVRGLRELFENVEVRFWQPSLPGLLSVDAATGKPGPTGEHCVRFGEGLVGEVAASLLPRLGGYEPANTDALGDDATRSARIVVPVTQHEGLIGVLEIAAAAAQNFDRHDLELVQLFSAYFGRAWDTAHLFMLAQEELTQRRETERALRESEEKYRTLFDSSREAMWVAVEGCFVLANHAAAELLGYAQADVFVGRHPADFSLPVQRDGEDSQSKLERMMQQAHVSGSQRFEWVLVSRDGQSVPMEIDLIPISYRQARALLAIGRDLTELRRAQAQQRLATTLFENIAEGILITDAKRRVLAINPAFTQITGYLAEELLGRTPRQLASVEKRAWAAYRRVWMVLQTTDHWSGELWARRKNGEIYSQWVTINTVRDVDGQLKHYVGLFSDALSNQRFKAQIDYISTHDLLTHLPGGFLFKSNLEQMLNNAANEDRRVAVVCLNLNRFRFLVASHGHASGDVVLKTMADRLCATSRRGDLVARFAGDTFAVAKVFDNDSEAEAISREVHYILRRCAEPIELDGIGPIMVTASAGIAIFPNDTKDASELLRQAESALFRAKQAEVNAIEFYSAEMTERARHRLMLETALRRAWEQRQFVLQYQPKVDLETGKVVGAEALIRWQPEREASLIGPTQFMPVLEGTDLVHPVGRWVIMEAARQARVWQDTGSRRLRVSINISSAQIMNGQLVRDLGDALYATGLDSGLFEIEVLESVLIDDPEAALETLKQVRAMGVSIALDDFGTGYSSLSYLKRFPVDFLKIDRSFIRDIVTDPGDVAIVRATVSMAHSLGIRVVAEGVETEAQLNHMIRCGCDLIQGYLVGHSVYANELEALVKTVNIRLPPKSKMEWASRSVLLVEDDPAESDDLMRLLRRQGWRVFQVNAAEEAFELLSREDIYVIVADYFLPGIDGVTFLERATRLYPYAVRVLMSRSYDGMMIADSLNRGGVFRYIHKSFGEDHIIALLQQAYEQARKERRQAVLTPAVLGKAS